MVRKRIVALCVSLAIIIGGTAGAFLFLSSDKAGNLGLFGLNGKAGNINNGSLENPNGETEAAPIAGNPAERDRLTAVGDMETLISILTKRNAINNSGPLYGDFSNGVAAGGAPLAELRADFEADVAAEAATSGAGSAPYSETNEQVQGVSEGDIVKTDGRFIYSMSTSDSVLRIISANGAELEVVSTISFDGIMGAEFYLIGGDRLALVGSEYMPIGLFRAQADDSTAAPPAPDRIAPGHYGYYANSTTLLIYDITDRMNPAEIRMVSMEGFSVSTRVIGDIVYLATNKQIWAIPYDQAENSRILPFYRDTAVCKDFVPVCFDRIYCVPETNDTNYMLIGAVDVYGEEQFAPEAYLGAGSNLYMSQNAMYITKWRWEIPQVPENSDVVVGGWPVSSERTDVLRFAIDGTDVAYTGMATVDGSPINQYSMDEFNGYFRIATTVWGAGTYVTVMSAADMRIVGRTEPLAPGEQMRSMRFVGDTGYVVTFENMDPLFTIDLSDPLNPVVMGELEIPGFSQYLHPVGDGLLLGIGRDTQTIYTRDSGGNETIVGFRDAGMKVSLFDVSDPFDPREIGKIALGEGWAEVSDNPRALMCDQSRGNYGFTVNRWDSGGAALIVHVEDGSISIAGTLLMDRYSSMYEKRLCFIGDVLYLIYDSGVIAFDYNSYDMLGELRF